MQRYLILLLCSIMLICKNVVAQEKVEIQEKSDFSIGQTLEIYSPVLEENRVINVYLPNGYHPDSLKTYPVIYLLDGSVDEDFIHIVGLVQFGSFSWINMLPETIVVGIANVDRKRDFTWPTNNERDRTDFPTTGGSEKFLDFLEQEVQPLIEKEFKVEGSRTLIGQSLGGLVATEILFKRPDLFDNYVIISPSLWWDDESLLETEPVSYEEDKMIYVGVGKEGPLMQRVAMQLYAKLASPRLENNKVFFNYFEELTHGDVLHQAVYDCFEQMFWVGKPE